MLEMDFAAKLLPVRILHPSVYHFLVRHAVHMLQHLQTHHQASGFAGAPLIRAIQGSEAFVEHRPVDHLGQAVEFVIAVEFYVQGSFFTPSVSSISPLDNSSVRPASRFCDRLIFKVVNQDYHSSIPVSSAIIRFSRSVWTSRSDSPQIRVSLVAQNHLHPD